MLKRFVLDAVQLDALLDARARDIAFVKRGGKLLYSPDQSTWSAFFFPVRDGQVHAGRYDNIIPGFAEAFVDADRSEEPFKEGSPLTGNQVTGMLGKVLMDAIFAPAKEGENVTEFFLTEESKAGLNEAIRAALRTREENVLSFRKQQSRVVKALHALSEVFKDDGDNVDDLFKRFAQAPENLKHDGVLDILMDDENPVNINERASAYNEVCFIDWSYIENALQRGEEGEEVLYFSRSDVREYEILVDDFYNIFSTKLPDAASKDKIISMSEILALNAIVERAGRDMRFIYLTNAPWAIRDFDRFAWDTESDTPLKPIRGKPGGETISHLFVRSPLCFLHDIEMNPRENEAPSTLKIFMDSVVPRQLHDKNRLSISQKREELLSHALNKLDDDRAKLYANEITAFYQRWADKKVPWVNEFLSRKGRHWADGLELFSKEGFLGFWNHVNHEFARQSWQLGVYVATMMDANVARAAPLVFIDCDQETNILLANMQAELAKGNIERFHESISTFINRPAERDSEERKQYFDALVNAVLFMFSNQFGTSLLHTEIACDLAMRSREPDVTGRESFYLRSHLMRVTAKDHRQIEMARKLMLVARSKLRTDNEHLPDGQKVSTIRFDVEDWSRRIVVALADLFRPQSSSTRLINLLRDYLSFVRHATESNLFGLSGDERDSLFERICERMKFNFMVMAVTLDGESKKLKNRDRHNSECFLADIVKKWNEDFGRHYNYLYIKVGKDEYDIASTIERAYLLALASGASKESFVDDDFDIDECVDSFFGSNNRNSIKLASTSFVDKKRYKFLEEYCKIGMNRKS